MHCIHQQKYCCLNGAHVFKAQISNCPVHGLRPKVRIELNRTFVRFKEFKAHVRLSSVAHYHRALPNITIFNSKCSKY